MPNTQFSWVLAWQGKGVPCCPPAPGVPWKWGLANGGAPREPPAPARPRPTSLSPTPVPGSVACGFVGTRGWAVGWGHGDTGTQLHAAGPQPGCARSPAGPGAATWARPCMSPSPRVPSLPSPPRLSPSPGLLAAAQSPHAIKAIRAPPQPGSPSLPRSLTVLNDFFEELAGGLQSPCRGWRGRRGDGDGDGAGAVTAARGP